MPFSHFNHRGRWLEMRDSRLQDLIDYCDKLFPEFRESQLNPEQLNWISDATHEWKQECELPPGCKTIKLDRWLSSSERCARLSRFFGFVAEKIKRIMPPTEAIIATESERVQTFVLESDGRK